MWPWRPWARARLEGRPFDERVRELARILDEDGYLADCEQIDPSSWRITELNCAILDVARHHREACGSELAFLRSVLPGASVERVTHILAGGHACSYEVRLTPGAAGDPGEAGAARDIGDPAETGDARGSQESE